MPFAFICAKSSSEISSLNEPCSTESAPTASASATSNAAKLLRADNRIGTLEKGKEASLVVVDGNPLRDVRALSSISVVMMKGERVVRSELFEQK